MSVSWWRSWHGAPTDHKWAVIANRAGVKVGIVSAVAWALLDYASQHENRGTVAGFDTETYAVYSGFDEREIIAVIQAMTDKGIIKDGRLTNWEKRQPQREDDSTPRVRKMREMKRNVTQGNAPDKDTDKDTRVVDEPAIWADDPTIGESKPAATTTPADGISRSLLMKIAKVAFIPETQREKIEAVHSMIDVYGLEKTETALDAAFQKWVTTKKKNGGGTYSPLNFGWVEKAQESLLEIEKPADDYYAGWELH